MLAYLDDILEPADAQELGQKIEESEFATGLMQRIRSSTRRLRLGAPKLEGKGMGQDANSVAEYLDNTLPPDQVPDFEKVCLESEAHLAEVAACHQVLTLVLGEPAEVEPATRERIYRQIGQPGTPPAPATVETGVAPVAEPTAEMSAAATAAAADTTPKKDDEDTKTRKKPEVPDYLKSDSKLRVWPMVITLLLALLLIAAVFMAVGPNKWFAGNSNREEAATTADGSPTVEPVADTPAIAPDPGGSDTGPVAAAPVADDDTLTDSPRPIRPAGVLPGGRDNAVGDPAAPVPVDRGGIPGPVIPGADPAAGAAPPDIGSVPPMPDETAGPPHEGGPAEASPPGIGPFELARVDPDKSPPPDVPDAEPVPPAASVADNVGQSEILIRQDRESGDWLQVPFRDPLHSGDRLIALPTSRPQILLLGDVQMTLDGGTAVRLDVPDAAGVPWASVQYGRAVLITIGKAGARVGVQMGPLRGVITFGDADATIALEVRPFQLAGTDPEAGDPHMQSKLYATSGSLIWEPEGGTPVRIEAGQVRHFIDATWAQTVDAGKPPKWIASKDLSEIDQQASEVLRDELPAGSEVSLRLYELSEHRRPEVKALAIRCGGHLDQFEPFISVLDNPLQRSYWNDHVDELVKAVQRGPATAALVRKALEKHRHADAKNLYRLLWGFSVDDLETGWDAKLVEYLDNDAMEYRVLAFENLQRITGGKSLLYRAELHADRRRPFVQRWRDRLTTGGIKYVTPPISLPEPGGTADGAADAAPPSPAGP
jgi:hypothetical protein